MKQNSVFIGRGKLKENKKEALYFGLYNASFLVFRIRWLFTDPAAEIASCWSSGATAHGSFAQFKRKASSHT